ncbi:MAG: ornithine cyclodeaminase family protein [Acidimicrobiaceae bacterium]|nr:ornithine cyclodeaminase family protein [Acidimicrobiaceae bacterium]
MRVLDADAVRAATPWPELIAAIAGALVEDAVTAPERHVHPVGLPGGGTGAFLLMPAWADTEMIGVKAVTYFPSNAGTDVPTVNAAYLAFDGGTGQVLAVLDGDELTARRTTAISALAADRLARPDAQHLLVVGTGALAPNMARAHASVRPLARIEVWGRRPEAAASVAQTLRAEGLPAEASDNLDASVGRADIVSCVTGATEPLVRGGLLSEGAHLDLVGSFQPDMRESDDEAAVRAAIFVDTLAGAVMSGDLAQPLADGIITEASIAADLQALATGHHPGRTSADEITLFKSAGFAAADLAAARLALR